MYMPFGMRHERLTKREPNVALSTSANLTDSTVAYTNLASILLLLLQSFMFAYEEMRMGYALYSFTPSFQDILQI